jgi:hypothetical protein
LKYRTLKRAVLIMSLLLSFQICQILGLTGIDLFSPSDVVERRDTRQVCMCIRSLSIKARSKNLDVSKEKKNLCSHEISPICAPIYF